MRPQGFFLVDIGMVVIANGVNLLLTVLFFLRTKGWSRAEHILGLIVISMALPVLAMVIYNLFNKRGWWTIILPLILILSSSLISEQHRCSGPISFCSTLLLEP
jgi:hypothetical protein